MDLLQQDLGISLTMTILPTLPIIKGALIRALSIVRVLLMSHVVAACLLMGPNMDLLHSLGVKEIERKGVGVGGCKSLTFPLLSIQMDPLNRQHSLQLPQQWITRPETVKEYHPPPPKHTPSVMKRGDDPLACSHTTTHHSGSLQNCPVVSRITNAIASLPQGPN